MPIELCGIFYTTKEAIDVLGYKDWMSVTNLIRKGILPATRIGARVYLIAQEDLNEYKKNLEQKRERVEEQKKSREQWRALDKIVKRFPTEYRNTLSEVEMHMIHDYLVREYPLIPNAVREKNKIHYTIARDRIVNGKTYQAIADEYGVTRESIRQKVNIGLRTITMLID